MAKGTRMSVDLGSEEISRTDIFKQLEESLQDIDGFSHIIAIYWFHKSEGYHLSIKTPWDDKLHGLFATRLSHRPCHLGLTVAELIVREKNVLKVVGLDGDAVDGIPLLDIKPYVPLIDERSIAKPGWLEGKLGKERS
jgi:tRNA-Thr(GGU) m(6)t(6)A37 methyltransferase TsaA